MRNCGCMGKTPRHHRLSDIKSKEDLDRMYGKTCTLVGSGTIAEIHKKLPYIFTSEGSTRREAMRELASRKLHISLESTVDKGKRVKMVCLSGKR